MSVLEVYTNPEATQEPTLPMCTDDLPLWDVWKVEPSTNGKPTKVPYNPRTGRKARANDSETFGTRAEAEAALATGDYAGIGFLILEALGITVVDVDDITDETAALQLATDAGTYGEWSPNGGMHLIFAGQPDPPRMTTAAPDLCRKAEHYTGSSARWMTYTGTRIAGTPEIFSDNYLDLERTLDRLAFQHQDEPSGDPEPAPAWTGDDAGIDTIIERAAKRSAKFRALFNGDQLDYPSRSEARYALFGILNFDTDDPAIIETIYQRSGQYDAKGRKRPDLIRAEISKQISTYRGPHFDPDYDKPTQPPSPEGTNTLLADPGVDGRSCEDVLAAAQARIAQLEAHIASQQKTIRYERETRKDAEDRTARLQEDVSALIHTVLNPELKHNQIVAMVATWGLVASKPRGDDGTVEISAAEISDDYRPRVKAGEHTPTFNPTTGTRPRMARSATKRVMENLIEAGIVTANAAPKRIERDGDLDYTTTVWQVERAPSLAAHLAPAVAFTPETPTARKPRTTTACPHCGEVHSRTRRTYCNGCGAETEPARIIPADEPVDADDRDTDDRVEKISTRETAIASVSVPRNSMVDKTSTRPAPPSRLGSSPPIAPQPTLAERMAAGGWD